MAAPALPDLFTFRSFTTKRDPSTGRAFLFAILSLMKFHLWHTLLSLFFAVFVVAGLIWLSEAGLLTRAIPLLDMGLMTLAIMRLTRLFTYDAITAFIREWFVGADPDSLAGSLGTLINCPWCTGLWFSFLVVYAYLATPYAWFVILILALSALAALLQLIANLIGWAAEEKKSAAQNLSRF